MIREAQINDIDGISKLLEEVLLVHHNIRPDIFKEKGVKYSKDEIIEIINNENTPVFVYVEDGKVLAHCFCQIKEKKETSVAYKYKLLFIDDFVVDSNSRQNGIGTSLYQYIKDYAKKIGCDYIRLNAWEGNDVALSFYKKQGLKPLEYQLEEKLEK